MYTAKVLILRSCRLSHLSNTMHVTISCCLTHASHDCMLVNLSTMRLKYQETYALIAKVRCSACAASKTIEKHSCAALHIPYRP